MSRVIRIDPEVKAAIDARRRPTDRSYSAVIERLLRHKRYLAGKSSYDAEEAQDFFRRR